jgi:hypothetical protein
MVPTGGSRLTSSKTNQADGRHGRPFTHGGPWATGAVLINLAETESLLRAHYRLERHCEVGPRQLLLASPRPTHGRDRLVVLGRVIAPRVVVCWIVGRGGWRTTG